MCVADVTRRIGRVFVHREVPKLIDVIGLVNGSNKESVVVLLIYEARHAENAGYVRGRNISTKLRGERSKQRFRLVRCKAVDFPNDLVFVGRSIENNVRCWSVARGADFVQ